MIGVLRGLESILWVLDALEKYKLENPLILPSCPPIPFVPFRILVEFRDLNSTLGVLDPFVASQNPLDPFLLAFRSLLYPFGCEFILRGVDSTLGALNPLVVPHKTLSSFLPALQPFFPKLCRIGLWQRFFKLYEWLIPWLSLSLTPWSFFSFFSLTPYLQYPLGLKHSDILLVWLSVHPSFLRSCPSFPLLPFFMIGGPSFSSLLPASSSPSFFLPIPSLYSMSKAKEGGRRRKEGIGVNSLFCLPSFLPLSLSSFIPLSLSQYSTRKERKKERRRGSKYL